jgi:hypothetical protein
MALKEKAAKELLINETTKREMGLALVKVLNVKAGNKNPTVISDVTRKIFLATMMI